ncbi:hypothetical protein EDC01DRAFT_162417 [Geopyxis carbonaria]|nr:hypothetical protein EDC01DRAFT_162417 [Geopyxis carbonaria]
MRECCTSPASSPIQMTSTETSSKPRPIERVTIRNHDWSYAHLQMIYDPPYTPAESSGAEWPPDILTWRTSLTSALKQFLGVTGTAIHIDILHLDKDEAWLRIPRVHMEKFGTAVSGYVGTSEGRTVGFRTVSIGEFLHGILGRQAEKSVWDE